MNVKDIKFGEIYMTTGGAVRVIGFDQDTDRPVHVYDRRQHTRYWLSPLELKTI